MTTTAEMRCARHPKEQTAITCASCGIPICPKCMVTTPVGIKCRDCGTGRRTALFQVRPERLLLAGITALIAGALAAVIGEIGFLAIFVSAPFGYFAGSMVLKASGMKRGLKLEIVAGAGMVIGALALKLLPAVMMGKLLARSGYSAISFGVASLSDPFFWVALAIAASCAVSKIRYL
ncbi:MAG TPA: B-box zinc finger protein [Armatimonadota bacterium]|nr:B-box zinc finger protein [Armatimonadota bacterium]